MVYVISKNGQALMPTENHAKVRILLKTKKAKVVILPTEKISGNASRRIDSYDADFALSSYVFLVTQRREYS